MSCEDQTARLLRASGHKLTPQRLMVLAVMRHHQGHLTAAEIFERVRERYPYVDISTVYRTMAVLKDARLVTETDLGTGDATFEWAGSDRHHHLICHGCGEITSLDHAYLQRLGAELLASRGFRADLDHFAIFGYCRACAGASAAAVVPNGAAENAATR